MGWAIVVALGVMSAGWPALAESQLLQVLIPPPPDPQARFDTLYADGNGRILMQYDLGRIENDKVYFSDGHPLFGIDDADALMLANTPGQPSKFAREHGLTLLPAQYFGGATSISVRDTGAPKCQWPYEAVATFTVPRRPPLKIMFLRRRDTPKVAGYEVWCEAGSGAVSLTTAYENLAPLVFLDPDGGTLVAFRHPAAVFRLNEDGRGVGPHLDGGIIAVPAALSENLLAMVAEGEISPDVAIKLFEADVDIISREQNAP